MGRYGLSVISALAERNRHDFVIWIGPHGDVPDELERADVKVVRSAAGAYEPLEHLRLPREIQREGVVVFHALTYSLPLSSPATTSMTLFDVIPLLFPGNYSVKAQLYWRHVLPRTVRRARRIVTLSEQTGKILLLFVPMAFTGVCTDEFCAVTQGLDSYESLGAKVLGISGDNPFAQAAWAEKEGIGITLLSDYEHTAAKDYGIAYDAFLPEKNLTMGGVPKRSAFVIDGNGVVQYAEVNDSPGDLPDFDAVKAALAKI